MITIYTVQQAKQTILRRDRALEPEVTPAMRARLVEIFGEEVTPAVAVARLAFN